MSTATQPRPWPRLSEQLDGPRDPQQCQRCGLTGEVGDGLEAWQEHDEWDQRERIIVVLCLACSRAVIESHPRLYRKLEQHEPFPGIMALCIDCVHREGVRCANPRAKANGGEGVRVTAPKPQQYHCSGTRGGRRTGWWATMYTGPATDCDGREVTP